MLWNNKKMVLLSFNLLCPLTMAANAAPVSQDLHVIVAPTCLIKNLQAETKTLSTSGDLVLLETNGTGVNALIEAKHRTTSKPCGGFRDVTHAWDQYQPKALSTNQRAATFLKKYENKPVSSFPTSKTQYSIKYQKQVNELLSTVFNPQNIWDDLKSFSDIKQFPDRYANSDTGVKAAMWIKDKIETLANDNHRDDVTVYTVATGRYQQPSVVAKIGNSDSQSTAAGVVIGAHMDTLSDYWEYKPGADDDGSGSMSLMEVARTLIASGMQFKKPIYLIWYSAEEEGLVGSSYVVEDFQNKKIPIDAVMQFDMTGYEHKKDPTLWLITDNVNTELTNFLETLITTYVKQPVGRTACGYACSDNASWNQAGYKASFPFEARFNTDDPYIHTAKDTMAVLMLNHMRDFAELGIGFAVELAEPTA